MKRYIFLFYVTLLCSWLLVASETPAAQNKVLEKVSFGQNLGAQVPLDAPFRDEAGKKVKLGDFFKDKPVILTLVYYECPMLCTETLNGLVRALRSLPWDAGKQFDIVTVSFDSRESSSLAAAKKKVYVERYGRSGAEKGWAFLTGDESSIRPLAEAAGFHYTYDSELGQYAHPTGIMVLTPRGKISRYLYGVEYSAKDLRLALADSAEGNIGSPVDQILLYCYRYDPLSGKYSLQILRVLRLAGISTVILIVVLIGWLSRRKQEKGV